MGITATRQPKGLIVTNQSDSEQQEVEEEGGDQTPGAPAQPHPHNLHQQAPEPTPRNNQERTIGTKAINKPKTSNKTTRPPNKPLVTSIQRTKSRTEINTSKQMKISEAFRNVDKNKNRSQNKQETETEQKTSRETEQNIQETEVKRGEPEEKDIHTQTNTLTDSTKQEAKVKYLRPKLHIKQKPKTKKSNLQLSSAKHNKIDTYFRRDKGGSKAWRKGIST